MIRSSSNESPDRLLGHAIQPHLQEVDALSVHKDRAHMLVIELYRARGIVPGGDVGLRQQDHEVTKDQDRLGDVFARCSFNASIAGDLGFFAVAFYGRPPARICSAQRHSFRH